MRNPNESKAVTEARHREEWIRDSQYRQQSHDRELRELREQMEKLKQETPDPSNWQLVDVQELEPYTVLKLKYSVKLHNGDKILVYRASLAQLVKQRHLDPHFGDEVSTGNRPAGYLYPIARFEPTASGWQDAIAYATKKSGRG